MKKVYMVLLISVGIIGLRQNTQAQTITGSLPVVLVDFSAALTAGNKVAISWTTQQEVNTDYFKLEKSNDGLSWRSIAIVNATGNSAIPVTYNSEDLFPLKGPNFYRIAITSQSGAVGRTAIKNVRGNALCDVNVFPNPSSGIVNVSLREIPPGDWSVVLINGAGQVVFEKKYNKSLTEISIPVASYLNGNYILKIDDGISAHSKTLLINHH